MKKITSKAENLTSPMMWIGMNPAYRLESNNKMTHASETFCKPKNAEETDKFYFRKRDGLSEYAEALFKSAVLISRK